ALPGFSSDIIQLGVHGVLDNPDVGSIVLRKIAQATGTTVSLKSLKAPEKAAKAYAKAKKELNKKKVNYSKAVKELKKATDEYAEFAAAWYLLGVCRSVLRDQAGALEAFEKSAAADPDYLLPSLGIAELRLQQNRFQEASDLVSQVLKRNPEVMRAYYIQAFANYSLGNVDVAEQSIRRVQDGGEARSYPGTHYLLGMILATKKDFRSAAAEFRRFLELTPLFTNAQELKQQLLDWEAQGLIEGALP
ncbi:tetratricopeptide repeat protein, partial [Acidobacteria bacterium AH-259-G07]|nr:tetratricopeptide repeat protein [Acidobacteria bacterium AH-259-G07]